MKFLTVLAIGLLASANSANAQTAKTPEEVMEGRLERALGVIANSDTPYAGPKIARAAWLDNRKLVFSAAEYERDAKTFSFDVTSKRQSKAKKDALPTGPARWPAGVGMAGGPGHERLTSPNGRWKVAGDGPNLVLNDLQSGDVKPLTEDGGPDYAYGKWTAHRLVWATAVKTIRRHARPLCCLVTGQ